MQAERSIWKAAASAWPVLAVVAVGWALAIRTLLIEWWVNPQYQYGLLVPLLCLVLLRGRIHDRPHGAQAGTLGRRLALAVAAMCAVVLAAMQAVHEANPTWRLVGAVCAAAIVTFTLALIYLAGGAPWLRHFAFPIAFFLIAVPLPASREEAMMSHLMQQNAGATVEVLGWLGHDAVRSGNLIRLPSGLLGIEEACSGVRSIRSGTMAALFVGEFFRVGLAARAGLLVLAVGTALIGNFLRTLFLAIMASSRGIDSIHPWHDPAGMTILVAIILVVWATASKLADRLPRPMTCAAPAAGSSAISLPRRFACAVGCFWLLAMLGTELWFRQHEDGWKVGPAWSVQMPPMARDWRLVKVSDTVAAQLRFDEGTSGTWVDSRGLRWQFFYFRWNPSLLPSQTTFGHRPESCLTGMGMKLESRYDARIIEKSGVRVPLTAYCFRDGHLPVHVFHAFVEDRERSGAQQAIPNDGSYHSRWQAVVHGKRNRGQRVVEIAVWGASDIGEAEKGLKEFLDHALVIDGANPADELRYTKQD